MGMAKSGEAGRGKKGLWIMNEWKGWMDGRCHRRRLECIMKERAEEG